MMKFELYKDMDRFMEVALDVLAKNEVQNNIIIGNCLKMAGGQDASNWLLAVVRDESDAIRLTGMMTPSFNICLYETDNRQDDRSLDLFIREMAAAGFDAPGSIAEKSLSARFSERYTAVANKDIDRVTKMRAYQLDEVNSIPVSSGRLRLATENDLFYLPYWFSSFTDDCHMGSLDLNVALEKAKAFLDAKSLYIWEDGFPVAMAAMGRKTMNCAVVSYVYTPPFFRGKGYASSCVAGLSRHLLDSGNKCCSLFTDLSNPISNSIYMKIGYNPVCDFDEFKFKTVSV